MKKIKLILLVFIAFLISSIIACNSGNKKVNDENIDSSEIFISDNKEEYTDSIENTGGTELGNEYTAKYICPNHCNGSGSDKEGECPECEMELMENPSFNTE